MRVSTLVAVIGLIALTSATLVYFKDDLVGNNERERIEQQENQRREKTQLREDEMQKHFDAHWSVLEKTALANHRAKMAGLKATLGEEQVAYMETNAKLALEYGRPMALEFFGDCYDHWKKLKDNHALEATLYQEFLEIIRPANPTNETYGYLIDELMAGSQ